MTLPQAKTIVDEFGRNNGNYSEEEEFLFIEAADYLIHETKDSEVMRLLGWHYESKECFDLALKYYEMALAHGNGTAAIGLGYIWYYGRTGTVDYEKAYYYFAKEAEFEPIAKIKIADMYHHGLFVAQDEAKNQQIIEELYRIYSVSNILEDPLPEICYRLAGIREREGNIPDAIRLLKEGKSYLRSHIAFNPFFGNFSFMQRLVHHLYRLTPLDRNDLELYDLYELLKTPVKVRCTYNGIPHLFESAEEPDGSVAAAFDGKWFRSFDDLLRTVKLDGYLITLSAWKFKNFEVISWRS